MPNPTPIPTVAAMMTALGDRVTERTAYNWVAGKTSPPAWAVVAVADALGLDVGALCRAFVEAGRG